MTALLSLMASDPLGDVAAAGVLAALVVYGPSGPLVRRLARRAAGRNS